MLKRIVVLGLAAALVGIPVAIAKNSSSPSPQRAPAVKPVAQKSPAAAKKRDKAFAEHDGQCPDDAVTSSDL
ncbi:MAG: hypothetical protein M3141_08965 [Actinomycetota bacterium]|nr:hypothetical protein [Actinomycetota bacterium]